VLGAFLLTPSFWHLIIGVCAKQLTMSVVSLRQRLLPGCHLEKGRVIEPSKSLRKDLQFPVTIDNAINDPDDRESTYY
jgi:hypothetical protein